MADGASRQMIYVDLEQMPSTKQEVWIATTNGKLFAHLMMASSEGTTDTLKLIPGLDHVSFALESSLKADSNVMVTAMVNKMVTFETLRFDRVCPDGIKLELEDSVLSADSTRLTVSFLRDDEKAVSINTRIDGSIEGGTAKITPTIYSGANGTAAAYIKPIRSGTGKIILSMKTTPCRTIPIETLSFTVP